MQSNVTIVMTEAQFDRVRSLVGKAARAYASDADTWRKIAERGDIPNAPRNVEVLDEEHAAALAIEELLTNIYIREVVGL